MLAAARPKDQQGGLGIRATVRAAVDAAEPGIEHRADQPEVEAGIRDTLGSSYYFLGEPAWPSASTNGSWSCGGGTIDRTTPEPRRDEQPRPGILVCQPGRGRGAHLRGRAEGPEDRARPDHPDTLTTMSNLEMAYRASGRTTEAIALGDETLKLRKAKLGPEHPETLITMNNLASVYQDVGRLAEAIPLSRRRSGS